MEDYLWSDLDTHMCATSRSDMLLDNLLSDLSPTLISPGYQQPTDPWLYELDMQAPLRSSSDWPDGLPRGRDVESKYMRRYPGGTFPQDRTPSPSRDTRSAVEDDYDVSKAIAEFASSRRGTRAQQRLEDIAAEMQLMLSQAARLEGLMSSDVNPTGNGSHYETVRTQFLSDATRLSLELKEQELAARNVQVEHEMQDVGGLQCRPRSASFRMPSEGVPERCFAEGGLTRVPAVC
mmetsp:Transcript_73168/g.174384  ORF Transcript_73168/g.174384 Transcript_73168/m.174384 type:complete len:235 (+) Transcript_73168:147-851(+)|eukprot:CAMPEP_0178388284 /NCGR_PEP_ID=MMETSP0689_2-20121128/9510_1 /TAXON_ID=160604 /ORGANISM="Amphidinium massartii, Strain CS-259" /LENGTH=234 /DNA_ID=CAMNT_0020008675 /DNA_START=67 /DNA_END=771 /DNA_ORIENTATION=+